jgi:hypothetical protein
MEDIEAGSQTIFHKKNQLSREARFFTLQFISSIASRH